jgi:hypothetical protein
MIKLPHHEFWPARWYEAPAYVYLFFRCAWHRLSLRGLLKANAQLNWGGIEPKSTLQKKMGAHKFPHTLCLPAHLTTPEKQKRALKFAAQHHYPLMLKPDMGFTGRGAFKVGNQRQLEALLPYLKIDYLMQVFVPFEVEYGVFFARYQGQAHILGINQKHFPTVIGDGVSSLGELVKNHPRRTHFWETYLSTQDLDQILPQGEAKRLSFIGSHTLGCKFTNDTHLITPALEKAVFKLFADTPGINYGRLDLVSTDQAAFQAGKFKLIEFNGIAALPTNIFDPDLSVWQSYRIFFAHLKMLVNIAAEHRAEPNQPLNLMQFFQTNKATLHSVATQQDRLEQLPNLASLA